MLEDPAAALERIYFEMYSRVEQVTGNPAPALSPSPAPKDEDEQEQEQEQD